MDPTDTYPSVDVTAYQSTHDSVCLANLCKQIAQDEFKDSYFDPWTLPLFTDLQMQPLDLLTALSPTSLDESSNCPPPESLLSPIEFPIYPTPALTTVSSPASDAFSSLSDAENSPSPPTIKHKKDHQNRTMKKTQYKVDKNFPIPHKIVEQKYRKSLDAAMRSLKGVIPNADRDTDTCCVPRLTKVGILFVARDYIKQLKRERERLQKEIGTLREQETRHSILLQKVAMELSSRVELMPGRTVSECFS